jgi:ribonuclease J
MDEDRTLIMEIGQVLEIDNFGAQFNGRVTSGKVLVDGLGIGDVGKIVLRDRKLLAEDGMIIAVVTLQRETSTVINGPDILTRGFVYEKESEEFIDDVKQVCMAAIEKSSNRNLASKKNKIKETIRDYVYQKTKRTPMIIPIIVEI